MGQAHGDRPRLEQRLQIIPAHPTGGDQGNMAQGTLQTVDIGGPPQAIDRKHLDPRRPRCPSPLDLCGGQGTGDKGNPLAMGGLD